MATTTEWLAGIGIGVIIGVAFNEKIRGISPGVFPASRYGMMDEWDSAINPGYKERPRPMMWREK